MKENTYARWLPQAVGCCAMKRGGRVSAIIAVQPRETLYVFVGGEGNTYGHGGFNGGGDAGSSSNPGYGGGGASDVRASGDALRDRILVARWRRRAGRATRRWQRR
jgi:hypothetical protein